MAAFKSSSATLLTAGRDDTVVQVPKGTSPGVNKLIDFFATPKLTRNRVWFAFAVSAITDAIQLGLGPAGAIGVAQVLDVIAMVLICMAIGFHPLLLPTFVLEALPLADMLPTWTGCTAAVVMLRKRSTSPASTVPPVIEVDAEVTRTPPKRT